MVRALLLVMLLFGWPAFGGVITPARLIDGPDSIESQLRLPQDLTPGRYVVQCEAWIRRQGRIRAFICYSSDPEDRDLVNAVARAGRQSKFVSATQDGRTIEAIMQVMVRVDTTGAAPLILAVPNNGADAKRYGPLYTAPQRLSQFTWYPSAYYTGGRILLWMNTQIDEHGNLIDYKLTNPSGQPKFFVERIEKQLKKTRFSPGHVDGKPVPMFHVEPVYD